MRCRLAAMFVLAESIMLGVIIDRIAVVVGSAIIKGSDIERNVRTTEFLNGQPLNLDLARRKEAVSRLIDQTLIRSEVRVGDYARATPEQAERELSAVVKQRFHTQAALQNALNEYGLTELQLREDFQWQLTVLRFVEARFKPAVFISDEAVQKYYTEHAAELRREYPGSSSLQDASDQIRNTLAEEQVNKLFFAWLDEQRKETKIQYLEEGLK
jgi:hypothetical protein